MCDFGTEGRWRLVVPEVCTVWGEREPQGSATVGAGGQLAANWEESTRHLNGSDCAYDWLEAEWNDLAEGDTHTPAEDSIFRITVPGTYRIDGTAASQNGGENVVYIERKGDQREEIVAQSLMTYSAGPSGWAYNGSTIVGLEFTVTESDDEMNYFVRQLSQNTVGAYDMGECETFLGTNPDNPSLCRFTTLRITRLE